MNAHESVRLSWRRPRRLVPLLAAALGLAMSVSACSSGSNEGAGAKRGGDLVFGQLAPTITFDPAKVFGNFQGGTALAAVYGTLTRYDDAAQKYVPYLAESLTPNSDSTSWTLKLRSGMTFTDGEPFDAQAVVANIERNRNAQVRSIAAPNFLLVKSVSAVDPRTVKIELTASYPSLGASFAGNGGWIAAPKYLEQLDGGDSTAVPVGAGPFVVSAFKPNESVLMEPNPKFVLGAAKLDSLKFVPITGGPTMVESLQSGGVQMAQIADFPTEAQADKLNDAKSVRTTVNGGSSIVLNARSGSPTHDVRLRQALAAAIDPKFVDSRVNQGLGSASNSIVKGLPGVPYDKAKAERLIAQVKRDTGWDGTLKVVCTNTPQQRAIPVALQALLQPLGITLDVTNDVDTNGLITAVVVKKDFDLACWSMPFQPEKAFQSAFTFAFSKSPSNQGGLDSPEMDAAVQGLRSASSEADLSAALQRFNEVYNQTVPAVILDAQQFNIYYRSSVHDVVAGGGATVLLDKAYVSR